MVCTTRCSSKACNDLENLRHLCFEFIELYLKSFLTLLFIFGSSRFPIVTSFTAKVHPLSSSFLVNSFIFLFSVYLSFIFLSISSSPLGLLNKKQEILRIVVSRTVDVIRN